MANPIEVQVSTEEPGEGGQPADSAAAAAAAAAGKPKTDLSIQAGGRPAWLPAKFKTAEEMSTAYADLERKLGTGNEKPAPGKKPDGQAAGLTDDVLEGYNRELLSNGKLSDNSYDQLRALGIPKRLVDAYVQGQQTMSSALLDRVFRDIGGADQYAAVAEWAKTNLDAATLSAYNADVTSGDPARVEYAVGSLKAHYIAGGGSVQTSPSPTRLFGNQTTPSGGDVFESREQVVAAMQSPAYKNDPAFRRRVERMLANSKV